MQKAPVTPYMEIIIHNILTASIINTKGCKHIGRYGL
jgi:hypothetical protein